jgi:hypothetical protein
MLLTLLYIDFVLLRYSNIQCVMHFVIAFNVQILGPAFFRLYSIDKMVLTSKYSDRLSFA